MRARNIKNDPKVNDDPGDGVVKQYKDDASLKCLGVLHQITDLSEEDISTFETARKDTAISIWDELDDYSKHYLILAHKSNAANAKLLREFAQKIREATEYDIHERSKKLAADGVVPEKPI